MENKKICIIRGTGTLGKALIEKYSECNDIYIISRDEMKQWQMKLLYPRLHYIIGDIRNLESLSRSLGRIKPHIIINCAALKHIDICENNISECIDTNILGTRNIITVSHTIDALETVVFISTDKACYPVNSYGMSKSISERMMAEASLHSNKKFVSVRYGNVLNSRGSLIPKFLEIAQSSQDFIPVTSDKMTRFFMKIEDSVELIHSAILFGESGDTWVPKLKSFKIIDLARCISEKYNKTIKIIGIRAGEKIHEYLINQDEIHRTTISHGNYVIKPCYKVYNFSEITSDYTSEFVTEFVQLKNLINL